MVLYYISIKIPIKIDEYEIKLSYEPRLCNLLLEKNLINPFLNSLITKLLQGRDITFSD